MSAAAHRWEALVGGIRVRFGAGRLAELGGAAAAVCGDGRPPVLLVTDPGVTAAGHAERAAQALTAAGFPVTIFDRVEPNPTADLVEAGAAVAREAAAGLLVAVGGGSALDTAKGINFLVTNGGRMEDYRGYGKAARPLLPALGVPTTAGTGSEAQSYALISHPVTHRKMACGDPKARFAEVILDPELLTTAPPPVTATAGLDALSHAVESYVSTAANPPSRLYAGEAFRLLSGALPALLGGGPPPAAWAAGLWGAHLAGAAIEQSMLGAAHALANPLTARYGIEHGAAVSLGLPGVVRFNGAVAAKRYGELARAAGLVAIDPVEAVATRIEELRALAGLPARLPQAGVPAGAPLPELAREAAEQWTGRFNPRPVTEKELLELYESVA